MLLAWVLAALAGWVDAVGLTHGFHIYLSFMSGNTTNLAGLVARQDWHPAGMVACVILLFVAGSVAGERVARPGWRLGRALVLLLEAAALGLAVALDRGLPAAFAMGVQTSVMHRSEGQSVSLTYVTGTLVQVGRSLAAGHFRAAGLHATLWLSLAAGAVAGMVLAGPSLRLAMVTPAVAALLLAGISAWREFASTRHRH
jgi:uncharacterized membrane protein YoaK (UPF0700 family)